MVSIGPRPPLLSEFPQALVNACKFLGYASLLSNDLPIFFGEASQFFDQIQFFFRFLHGNPWNGDPSTAGLSFDARSPG